MESDSVLKTKNSNISTIWMDLEDIKLREISQSHTDKSS